MSIYFDFKLSVQYIAFKRVFLSNRDWIDVMHILAEIYAVNGHIQMINRHRMSVGFRCFLLRHFKILRYNHLITILVILSTKIISFWLLINIVLINTSTHTHTSELKTISIWPVCECVTLNHSEIVSMFRMVSVPRSTV